MSRAKNPVRVVHGQRRATRLLDSSAVVKGVKRQEAGTPSLAVILSAMALTWMSRDTYGTDVGRWTETFESYSPTTFIGTWKGSGATLGLEDQVSRSGSASMSLSYHNPSYLSNAEASTQWPSGMNFSGSKWLRLWFKGEKGNASCVIYVALQDAAGKVATVQMPQDATQAETWTWWDFPLDFVAAHGVNLAAIKVVSIGVWGKGSGVLHIDDIIVTKSFIPVLYVDGYANPAHSPDGSAVHPYRTIETAVAAAMVPGTEILVQTGTYGFEGGTQARRSLVLQDKTLVADGGYVELKAYDISGTGKLLAASGSGFILNDCSATCLLDGGGTTRVSGGSTLTFAGNAEFTMRHLICDGRLRAEGSSRISDADVVLAEALFREGATITGSTIHVDAQPPRRLRIEDAADLYNNAIYANGDGYLDLDPTSFGGKVNANRFYVTIPAHSNYLDTQLLELRGQDITAPPTGSGIWSRPTIPSFSLATWTLDRLVLSEGARAVLANRFDYQAPLGSGGDQEVMYVKELILGAHSVLDTGAHRLYYGSKSLDPSATILNNAFIGCPLATISFSDPSVYQTMVQYNSYATVDKGLGTLQMTNATDSAGQTHYARAKAQFPRASTEKILVRLRYRFDRSVPGVLVVYLSSDPNAPSSAPGSVNRDPTRYREIGRIAAPTSTRPGAPGRAWAISEMIASTAGLDLSKGMWVELEAGESRQEVKADVHCEVSLQYLTVVLYCSTGIPGDINSSRSADEDDFIKLISACGSLLDSVPNTTSGDRSCGEISSFCADGYVDLYDVVGYDFFLNSPLGESCLAACPGAQQETSPATAPRCAVPASGAELPCNHVVVLGKKGTSDIAVKLEDALYVFDDSGTSVGFVEPSGSHTNIRIVEAPDGRLCRVSMESGLVQVTPSEEVIVPAGSVDYDKPDPRYGVAAKVYIGAQSNAGQANTRPILDVGFDRNNPLVLYVVPAVVVPTEADPNRPPYAAAARLVLRPSGGDPPYDIDLLYDSPYHTYCNHPREIEVDGNGNIYVLNVHRTTQTEALVKYDPQGQVTGFLTPLAPVTLIHPNDLEHPEPMGGTDLSDPIAMSLASTNRLFVASGLSHADDPNDSTVCGFDGNTLQLKTTITIHGMRHVTSITEQPGANCLWIVGLGGPRPNAPHAWDPPFYTALFAKAPLVSGNMSSVEVNAEPLATNGSWPELALPTSAVWRSQ